MTEYRHRSVGVDSATGGDVELQVIASVSGRTTVFDVLTKSDEHTHVLIASADGTDQYRTALRVSKEAARQFARDIIKGLRG